MDRPEYLEFLAQLWTALAAALLAAGDDWAALAFGVAAVAAVLSAGGIRYQRAVQLDKE